jgi:threonine 3-dehydrogenase
MKMNALIKDESQKGLTLVQVDKPKLREGHALVKIQKTAICGTDLTIWDGKWVQPIKNGTIIGHEFVGIIEEIQGKTIFKVGDVVTGEGHIVCKECRNCRRGAEHFCINTIGWGVKVDGIFAEYAVLPLTNLVAVNPKIDRNVVAFMDALGNATHSTLMYPIVGEDILITGAGPIGIMSAGIARHCGAKNIVITDLSDYRLDLAKKVCPTAITVRADKEKLSDVMKRLDMTEGFDIGLEMSGSKYAFQDMIEAMAHGGKISLLGVPAPDAMPNWKKIVFGMLTIKGIYGRDMYDGWYKMNAMLSSGLNMSPLVTHEFDYKDFKKAFELGLSGNSGKIILNWS